MHSLVEKCGFRKLYREKIEKFGSIFEEKKRSPNLGGNGVNLFNDTPAEGINSKLPLNVHSLVEKFGFRKLYREKFEKFGSIFEEKKKVPKLGRKRGKFIQ